MNEGSLTANGASIGAKPFRIAVVSSFTFQHFKKKLEASSAAAGIPSVVYCSPYGQHIPELLNAESDLYKFDPNLVIIFIDTQAFLGDDFFNPYGASDEDRRAAMRGKEEQIHQMLKVLGERTSATIILHNFDVPAYSPLGILENKHPFGFVESIEELNANLRREYKQSDRIFIFDYNAFASRLGKREIMDPKMYYLADMKLDGKHFDKLCDSYLAFIKPLASRSKKCLVLDLDNTLWGGVVGEDGFEGIALGPTPEGRPFLEFQKHILNLHRQGIILALNSKNNKEDALKVLREHPYMVLKEEHFAAVRINWQDKASNMRELAEELNIGIDSMVFIDDDATNRALVRHVLPEVGVVDLPEDPALFVHTLMRMSDFNRLKITEEDRARGALYTAERKRTEFQRTAGSLAEFLESLQLKVKVLDYDAFTKPRIAQLTQKTNQFNATTKRYTEEEIERMVRSGRYNVKCFQAKDRFGDYGIIGTYIIEKGTDVWSIDTFLMSCRVIGKGVEHVIMAKLMEDAKRAEIKQLLGTYLQTKKNVPMKDFFHTCGFTPVGSDVEDGCWQFNVAEQRYPHIDKIELLSNL
jgi:FkbH-like protein